MANTFPLDVKRDYHCVSYRLDKHTVNEVEEYLLWRLPKGVISQLLFRVMVANSSGAVDIKINDVVIVNADLTALGGLDHEENISVDVPDAELTLDFDAVLDDGIVLLIVCINKLIIRPNIIRSYYPLPANQIEGLKLDLNARNYADNMSIEDVTNKISQWDDESEEGNNAIQGTYLSQPILELDSINGLPSVKFDGVDDRLVLDSVLPNPIRDFTIAVALKFIPGVHGTRMEVLMSAVTGNPTRAYLIYNFTLGILVETRLPTVDGDISFLYSEGTILPFGLNIQIFRMKGEDMTMLFNSEDKIVNVVQYGDPGLPGFQNVRHIGSSTIVEGGFTNVNLGRLLYYDKAISDDELFILNSSLRSEWG